MSPAAPTAAQAMPRISYTGKPAFTNSAGQACREYKANAGGRDVFGTACQQAGGQWRVVN
jgi:surface antigen